METGKFLEFEQEYSITRQTTPEDGVEERACLHRRLEEVQLKQIDYIGRTNHVLKPTEDRISEGGEAQD
jgi:hypothetical protein